MNTTTPELVQGALRIALDPACNHCNGTIPWFNNHLGSVAGSIVISPELTDPTKWPSGPASGIAPPRDGGSGTLEKLFKHLASYINCCFGGPPHDRLGGMDYHLLTLNRMRKEFPEDDLCTFLRRDGVAVALTTFCDAALSLHSVLKLTDSLEFPFDTNHQYKLGLMRFNPTGSASGTVAFHTDPVYKVVTGFTLIMQEESQAVRLSTLDIESSLSSIYSSTPSSSDAG
jgi:hypothetical protein